MKQIEEVIPVSQQISFETYRGSAAENYEKYFVPVIGAPLAADLIAHAAPRPDERVLDLACGTGVVARLAAARLGPDASIVGIDINPDMVAVARATNPNGSLDFRQASAEQLPCPDESVDLVLCSLGAQFFPDRHVALTEVRRVLAPGGRLALNGPGPIPEIFAMLEAALSRHVSADAAAFLRRVFSLHEPAEVRELLTTAGFQDVDATATVRTLQLPAPRAFVWQYLHSTPLAAAVANLDDRRRVALEHEVTEGWQQHICDGQLQLHLGVTVATARR